MTKSSRRTFLENFSKIGALSLLPASAVPALAMGVQETNFVVVGPYLQNISPTEATVMWITHKNCFSWIEYGDRNHLNKKFFSHQNGLIQANNRVNKITLSGIKPGQSHRYRIVSTEILGVSGSQYKFGEPLVSEVYSFKTPAESDEEFKMVIFNDHHERPQTIPQLLYRFGYNGNEKDFDLVVFNGDVFDNSDSEEQLIDQFLKPCVEIFAKEVPFLFVQGNHEVRGAFSRQLPEYLGFTDNKYYYAFTRGPVRVVVLDSGEDKADDNWEYGGLAAFDQYREIQKKWLEKEIASPEFEAAAFRVVLIHISPWHSGDWHGTLHCREMFGPLLNKGNIDLQVSGHTHRYTTHDADNDHHFPIVIGGGPADGSRTFIKFHATPKNIKIDMLKDDGELVGSYALNKK
ncbi:MAG: metallophosphoesterase family protein [Anditalea sp.]